MLPTTEQEKKKRETRERERDFRSPRFFFSFSRVLLRTLSQIISRFPSLFLHLSWSYNAGGRTREKNIHQRKREHRHMYSLLCPYMIPFFTTRRPCLDPLDASISFVFFPTCHISFLFPDRSDTIRLVRAEERGRKGVHGSGGRREAALRSTDFHCQSPKRLFIMIYVLQPVCTVYVFPLAFFPSSLASLRVL